MERGAAKLKKKKKKPKNNTVRSLLRRESDSPCWWSALLTLLVIASLFNLSRLALRKQVKTFHCVSCLSPTTVREGAVLWL